MPSRKTVRIGKVPKKKKIVTGDINETKSAEDLLSQPLDTFFLTEDAASSDTPPIRDNQYTDSDGFQANEFLVVIDKLYKYCPDTDLDEFVCNQKFHIFTELRENCKHGILNENFMYMNNSSDLKYVQLYDSDIHWATPRVKTCVSIGRDMRITISVHGKNIPDAHIIWGCIGRFCANVQCVEKVLKEVEKYDICCGNQDSDLHDLIPVSTFLDVSDSYKYQGYRKSFYIGSTIRATKCNFMINSKKSTRCEHCNTYRWTLRKTLSRRQHTPKVPTPDKDWRKSKTANSRLTDSQKFHKIKQLKEYSNQLETEVARLKREIKKKKT